jgi:hypothetical protein
VQIVDVLSDDFALEILPRAVANAVTRIDGRLAVGSLGAQIGAPDFSSCAVALCQLLTMLVGAFKAAEIGALAGPALVTKNVMFGACGSCGAACCAGCCCASTPDITPSDASASVATMIVFRLFIAVLSAGDFRMPKN